MVMRMLRGDGGEARIERIEQRLQEMLANDRHSFDVAMSALLAGADPDVVGPDLHATDRLVNEAERDIRRELVVHVSVQTNPDTALVLIYMSVVKDIERIGDYAKNIYDIAALGVRLTDDEDHGELLAQRDRVSQLISETGRVFAERDTDRARALIAEGDEITDIFDEHVDRMIKSDLPARYAVPRALLYRHLKRIVAHCMNVMSAVVMPVDRIDYFDEDPTDRG